MIKFIRGTVYIKVDAGDADMEQVESNLQCALNCLITERVTDDLLTETKRAKVLSGYVSTSVVD